MSFIQLTIDGIPVQASPGMTVLAAARQAGAFQGIISGAGSTLMAYAPLSANATQIGEAMVQAMAAHKMQAEYKIVNIEKNYDRNEKLISKKVVRKNKTQFPGLYKK